MGPFNVVGAADAKDEKEAEKTTDTSDKTAIFLVIVESDGMEKLLRLGIVLPSTGKFFRSIKNLDKKTSYLGY